MCLDPDSNTTLRNDLLTLLAECDHKQTLMHDLMEANKQLKWVQPLLDCVWVGRWGGGLSISLTLSVYSRCDVRCSSGWDVHGVRRVPF